ncbi:TPA: molecular chaperone [Serratia odorifera]|nr:molecular chaperone [Serratia odorifera]
MKFILINLLSLIVALSAEAGIMPASTRVVYEAHQREKTLMLVNTNRYPIIVQSWVDKGAGDPDTTEAPFVVLPAVFRLQPERTQGIKIVYNRDPMPADRETLFWLNLYEIPPTTHMPNDNTKVTLTMNTQLKLFFRPAGIMATLSEVADKLVFRIRVEPDGSYIECQNPGPLHVSLTSVALVAAGNQYAVEKQPDMMIGPFSSRRYRFSAAPPSNTSSQVKFQYLNDAGGVQEKTVPITR